MSLQRTFSAVISIFNSILSNFFFVLWFKSKTSLLLYARIRKSTPPRIITLQPSERMWSELQCKCELLDTYVFFTRRITTSVTCRPTALVQWQLDIDHDGSSALATTTLEIARFPSIIFIIWVRSAPATSFKTRTSNLLNYVMNNELNCSLRLVVQRSFKKYSVSTRTPCSCMSTIVSTVRYCLTRIRDRVIITGCTFAPSLT